MITDGIININKPQNMTSHDVVSVIRRTLGIKRIGHTGTLDPMATGVLPICIGKSTRIIEYLDMDIKKYRCKLILGMETDTQDIWGETLAVKDTAYVTEEMIYKAFESFNGVILQKPPMYSALKVNGKKLYEYARAGETVEVKTRKVYIKSLDIEEISLEEKYVVFTVECSKGTYIRTICQDVGSELGCFGTLGELERVASGMFDIENAIDLDKLRNMSPEEIEKIMLPTEYPLIYFGEVKLNKFSAKRFIDGWHLELSECNITKEPIFRDKEFYLPIREEYRHAYNIYYNNDGQNEFLGVAFYNDKFKKLVADKVFYRG